MRIVVADNKVENSLPVKMFFVVSKCMGATRRWYFERATQRLSSLSRSSVGEADYQRASNRETDQNQLMHRRRATLCTSPVSGRQNPSKLACRMLPYKLVPSTIPRSQSLGKQNIAPHPLAWELNLQRTVQFDGKQCDVSKKELIIGSGCVILLLFINLW